MNIVDAFESFLLDQRVKGNSEKTIIYYRSCFEHFKKYCGDDFLVKNLSVDLLKHYLLHLANTEISSISVQSYIRGIRAFLNWLYIEEYVFEDLCLKFKLPRASRKVIDVLSDDEVFRILSSLSGSDWLSIRNNLIICLMLDCGLRLNEVVTLKTYNVKLNDRYLIVSGKGDKQRFVPFGNSTYSSLIRYLSSIQNAGYHEYLLIKVSASKCGFDQITEATIKNMFRRLRVRSGIHRLYPHLLRHTFATRYLENGGNIYTLQSILGHSSLEMVKKYLHLASSRIRSDFPRFSPLDNIKRDPPK